MPHTFLFDCSTWFSSAPMADCALCQLRAVCHCDSMTVEASSQLAALAKVAWVPSVNLSPFRISLPLWQPTLLVKWTRLAKLSCAIMRPVLCMQACSGATLWRRLWPSHTCLTDASCRARVRLSVPQIVLTYCWRTRAAAQRSSSCCSWYPQFMQNVSQP